MLYRPKRSVKNIVRNGIPHPFQVFEEPQADLYQVHISGLGTGLFTKKEIDAGLTRAVNIRAKYGLVG